MEKRFVELADRTLNTLYITRRAGILDGDFTEDEVDKLIADVAREKKEKYDSMSHNEIAYTMLRELLEHIDIEDPKEMEEE